MFSIVEMLECALVLRVWENRSNIQYFPGQQQEQGSRGITGA